MPYRRVCVDAGHGGSDPGAVADGLKEKDIVLDIADRLAVALCEQGIYMRQTRIDNSTWRNLERVMVANEYKADVFVSIHCNAATNKKARGFEVIHYPGSVRGKALATSVADALTEKITWIPKRKPSVKDYTKLGRGENFYLTVIRDTKMPAIIVEVAFITNKDGRASVDEGIERQKVAEAICLGIRKYLETLK